MTEPGGYLQWGEPDVASFRIEQTSPGSDISALTELMKMSQPQDARLSPQWVPKLSALFEAAGLEAVESHVIKDAPPHIALATHECNLVIHELVARRSGNSVLLAKVRELMPKLEAETRDGAYWAFTRYTVVGKKPEPQQG